MHVTPADLEREWQFFEHVLDPLVRELLSLDDPWEAYQRASAVGDLMTDTSPGGAFDLPHAGGVYIAWRGLTDLYEIGETAVADAHATLRDAAMRWLDRPAKPTSRFIEEWMSETSKAVERGR